MRLRSIILAAAGALAVMAAAPHAEAGGYNGYCYNCYGYRPPPPPPPRYYGYHRPPGYWYRPPPPVRYVPPPVYYAPQPRAYFGFGF